MKALLRNYKYRLVDWLDNELAASRARRSTSVVPTAQIDPSAMLAPEASISNPTGDLQRVRIGSHSLVLGRLVVFPHGGEIEIGEFCYVGHRSEIWSMDNVHIGNRVLISHNVTISDTSAHSLNHIERAAHFATTIESGQPRTAAELPGVRASPIRIEDDVWINVGATILRGVTIGARSVIAAGSIVTKDVPPDSIFRNQLQGITVPIASVR